MGDPYFELKSIILNIEGRGHQLTLCSRLNVDLIDCESIRMKFNLSRFLLDIHVDLHLTMKRESAIDNIHRCTNPLLILSFLQNP